MEQALADLWAHVLRVKPVGIHDNFFELGGTSLLAVDLFAQIERRFGVKLPLTSLIESPTIEAARPSSLPARQSGTLWFSFVTGEPGRRYFSCTTATARRCSIATWPCSWSRGTGSLAFSRAPGRTPPWSTRELPRWPLITSTAFARFSPEVLISWAECALAASSPSRSAGSCKARGRKSRWSP